jgi:hypothetical protein
MSRNDEKMTGKRFQTSRMILYLEINDKKKLRYITQERREKTEELDDLRIEKGGR